MPGILFLILFFCTSHASVLAFLFLPASCTEAWAPQQIWGVLKEGLPHGRREGCNKSCFLFFGSLFFLMITLLPCLCLLFKAHV